MSTNPPPPPSGDQRGPAGQPGQDPNQPPGQWGPPQHGQWGPPPPPGQQWQPSNPVPPAPRKSWFARHKILTTVLALVVLFGVVGVAGGGGGGESTAAEDTTSTSGEEAGASSQDEGSGEGEGTAQDEGSGNGGSGGSGGSEESNDGGWLSSEQENDTPSTVGEGKAFTHDGYAVPQGWKVVREQFGSVSIQGLSVTNESDSARIAQLTFTFLKGNENLAEVECSSNELQPGQKSAMDCFSTSSSYPEGYQEIRVADMW